LSILACLIAVGCKETGPISHVPTHLIIVSGANQSGDLSAALAQPLVVQALDGANKPVAGVPLTWTVMGGGTVTPTTSVTDKDGKATVTGSYDRRRRAGRYRDEQPTGNRRYGFICGEQWRDITGTSPGRRLPFGASSRERRRAPRDSEQQPRRTPPWTEESHRRRFDNGVLGVASAGSASYSSMPAPTPSRMQARVSVLAKSYPLSHAEISPAMLAARMRVDDSCR
jgi:hypothetical protein